jgi:hypothetical protein
MAFMLIFAPLHDIQSRRTLTFSTPLVVKSTQAATTQFATFMKNSRIVFALLFLFTLVVLAPACSKKSGCPATESLKPKTDRKGNFKKSKGSSSDLFPKKMRKKLK